MTSNEDLEFYFSVPEYRKSHIKHFLRPAKDGERSCVLGEHCIALRINNCLEVKNQQKESLREFLTLDENDKFIQNGVLPIVRKFCYLCHTKYITHSVFSNMATNYCDPGDKLQTHHVDPNEYSNNIRFVPYHSLDSVSTGITFPIPLFNLEDYHYSLDDKEEEEELIVKFKGL